MGKIKAGLIGCGRIGYSFDLDEKRRGTWTHAGAYHKSDKVDFVGAYDTYKSVNECASKYNVKAYPNIKEMVEELDVISIAVPESLHERVLEDILALFKKADKTPKVLWVEKPFTGNLRIARDLVDRFAAYNCHIHINYQRRFCEGFEFIKGKGVPSHVDVTYVRGLYNTASHFVDFIVGLYGKPDRVSVSKMESDFVMHYNSFRVNFSMLEGLRYNICDTTFYHSTEVIRAPALQTSLEITKAVASEQYSEYLDLGEPVKQEMVYEPMLKQVETIAEAVKTGKYNKLNNGLITLQILEKASND